MEAHHKTKKIVSEYLNDTDPKYPNGYYRSIKCTYICLQLLPILEWLGQEHCYKPTYVWLDIALC